MFWNIIGVGKGGGGGGGIGPPNIWMGGPGPPNMFHKKRTYSVICMTLQLHLGAQYIQEGGTQDGVK